MPSLVSARAATATTPITPVPACSACVAASPSMPPSPYSEFCAVAEKSVLRKTTPSVHRKASDAEIAPRRIAASSSGKASISAALRAEWARAVRVCAAICAGRARAHGGRGDDDPDEEREPVAVGESGGAGGNERTRGDRGEGELHQVGTVRACDVGAGIGGFGG